MLLLTVHLGEDGPVEPRTREVDTEPHPSSKILDIYREGGVCAKWNTLREALPEKVYYRKLRRCRGSQTIASAINLQIWTNVGYGGGNAHGRRRGEKIPESNS